MKKNLLFHCHIKDTNDLSDSLNFNLKCLQTYIDVFDGKKIVSIATENPESFEIQSCCTKIPLIKRFDEIKIVKNDPHNRESESLLEMLNEVRNFRDSMTFYAHSKGSTWPLNECLKNWILSMYFFNLEKNRIYETESHFLSGYVTSGILKKDCKWNFDNLSGDWHYSGAFFWFSNDEFFKHDWKTFSKGRMSLETYLGQRIPTEKAVCSFVNRSYNFSIDDALWESEIQPQLIGEESFKKYKSLFDS